LTIIRCLLALVCNFISVPSIRTGAEPIAANNTVIRFAVVMSVFTRPGDPNFLLPQITSLAGLVAQSYKEWTLIVVGDGLLANEIASVFRALDNSHIPRRKVLFQNMDSGLREKWLYETASMVHGCDV
jgi:hypothetical protein